jgi:hypothetical protein
MDNILEIVSTPENLHYPCQELVESLDQPIRETLAQLALGILVIKGVPLPEIQVSEGVLLTVAIAVCLDPDPQISVDQQAHMMINLMIQTAIQESVENNILANMPLKHMASC